jgi:rod shape-determining protein MreD
MNSKSILLFLITGVFFYFLALLEISFFPFFDIFIFKINVSVLIAVLICFIEEPKKYIGLYCAFWVGFFLDVFSFSNFFGIATLSMFMLAGLIKLFLHKYVKIPSFSWLSKIQN